MAEAVAITTPLTQIIGRHVGRNIPPEQDVTQMSRRRFLCEKTVSLIIVFVCCLTLSITTLVKLEEISPNNSSAYNSDLFKKLYSLGVQVFLRQQGVNATIIP